MLQTKILFLAVSLAAGAVAPLYAQVDKPRTTVGTGAGERLPAPAKVTATQDPRGFIRVVWSAVEGAERYSVTRSVPPAGAGPVSLPNPADTVYLDHDVQPGSTYYYLVGAINEAGIMGLKASGTPVTFRPPVPPPPGAVRAVLNGGNVMLTWNSGGADVPRFQIERGVVTENKPPSYLKLVDRECCSMADNLEGRPGGTRVVYRVRSVSRWGDISEPALSNEVTTPTGAGSDSSSGGNASADSTAGGNAPGDSTTVRTRVLPAAVAAPAKIRVGGSALKLGAISTFTDLRLQKPRWVSLNEAVATVTSDGRVRGRSPGFTYIVVTGLTPDGAVASMVTRIDVTAS